LRHLNKGRRNAPSCCRRTAGRGRTRRVRANFELDRKPIKAGRIERRPENDGAIASDSIRRVLIVAKLTERAVVLGILDLAPRRENLTRTSIPLGGCGLDNAATARRCPNRHDQRKKRWKDADYGAADHDLVCLANATGRIARQPKSRRKAARPARSTRCDSAIRLWFRNAMVPSGRLAHADLVASKHGSTRDLFTFGTTGYRQSVMELHTAGHHRGVVCAPHSAAVEAGHSVLVEGGNALEAMIAMAASVAVVYPHMNGIGGDGFWLIREPSGRLRALMAAGRAGSDARIDLYREAGYDAIPSRGPLAALTVPGAIAGWMLACEAAQLHGGHIPVDVLLGPAIRHAGEGVGASKGLADCVAAVASELKQVPGFAQTFLIDNKQPQRGDLIKQPALAATLDQLAHAGLDDFYRGDVAREIAADLERLSSPVTRSDLERTRATFDEPLSVTLAAGTVYNTPPPTQGLASLLILAIFDRLGINEAESFDHVHGLVEAAKRAFRLRDGYITDPDYLPHSPERYLTAPFLDAEAAAIDRRTAAPWTASPAESDTIWMGAADGSGLVVSYIQSLYWEFGSGMVLPRTGILMQNRGTSFSLARDARNRLEPGRLPPHTLNPALAVLHDGRVMAYGTMGGDAQPQMQAELFTRYVLYRQPLDQALDRPRWIAGRTWGSANASLMLEGRFDGHLIDRLSTAGHDVIPLSEPYAGIMGHAGAVVLHPNGMLEGAHDPRADGGAAGV
jgi:oxamate amidohydrolase